MKKYKPSDEALKLINFKELSLVLTGDSNSLRRTFIPKRLQAEVKNLDRYLTRFINNNRTWDDTVPRVEVELPGSRRVLVKAPDIVQNHKVIKALPKEVSKLENGLFKFDGKFYTTKFSKKTGVEVREYYELEDAKKYLSNK